jgi:hypothetical protein
MSTHTTHANGAAKAFDPSQGEWKELARQSTQKPLPPEVSYHDYRRRVGIAWETGRWDEGTTAMVKGVLEFQNYDQSRVPTHPDHSDSPNGQEAEGRQQALVTKGEPGPGQDAPEDVQPGDETGEIETGLLDASTGQSEPKVKDPPNVKRKTKKAKAKTEKKVEAETPAEDKQTRQGWVDWSSEWREWSMEPTQKPTEEKVDALEHVMALLSSDPNTKKEHAKRCWHRAISRTYWSKGEYHYLNENGRWGAYKKEDLLTILNFTDLLQHANPILGKNQATAWKQQKFEAFKARVMTGNHVDFSGELAGHQPGLLEWKNQRYLIKYGPDIIKPAPGDPSPILNILTDLLGEEQLPYILGWLKTSYEALVNGEMCTGQMLVLAGPPGIGKSFVKEFIIRPILGGRHTDPSLYLQGKTQFNADTSRAESWEIDDVVGSTDSEKRKMMTGAIKKLAASNDHRIEAKHSNAIQPPPTFHRLTVYTNDGVHDLWVLPELNDSTVDKAIILKASKAELPLVQLPGPSKAERESFRDLFTGALPAFVDYLLNWEIPEGLRNGRYAIKAYQHKDIAEDLEGMSDEGRLLSMIDHLLEFPKGQPLEGRAMAIESALRTAAEPWRLTTKLNKVIWYERFIGNTLKTLRRTHPERVELKKKDSGGYNIWVIHPPKEDEKKPRLNNVK